MGHAKAYYNPARYVSHGIWATPGDLWTWATPRPTTTPPGTYLTAPGLRRAISGHGTRQGLLQPRQVRISRHLGYAGRSLDMGHAKAYYNPDRYVSHGTWATPGYLWTWATPRPTTTQPGTFDLEAGDNRSLKIQVARPGIEPRSSCSASQELNHSATAAPRNVVHYMGPKYRATSSGTYNSNSSSSWTRKVAS